MINEEEDERPATSKWTIVVMYVVQSIYAHAMAVHVPVEMIWKADFGCTYLLRQAQQIGTACTELCGRNLVQKLNYCIKIISCLSWWVVVSVWFECIPWPLHPWHWMVHLEAVGLGTGSCIGKPSLHRNGDKHLLLTNSFIYYLMGIIYLFIYSI